MMATDLGAFDPADSYMGDSHGALKLKTEIEIFS
jgi:hypothetical protein